MNFRRTAHNFLMKITGGSYQVNDLEAISKAIEFAQDPEPKKFKVALLFICLNQPYWQYIKDAVEGAKQYFLPGHDVSMFLWSDLPFSEEGKGVNYGTTVFPTEAVEWPLPTLFRYHLFLQQEETLKDLDYIFYCDIDMRFMNVVGDEVLGKDITAAQHPMYALRESFYAPFEPNKESTAYVPYPKHYFAGGFQGGTTESFLKAMKVMKKNIDKDFSKNYVARWNDESHWNRYLVDNPPSIILSPSMVYPDSLIEEYYKKIWGRDYPPKIVTLTKKFTVSKEAGEELKKQLGTM